MKTKFISLLFAAFLISCENSKQLEIVKSELSNNFSAEELKKFEFKNYSISDREAYETLIDIRSKNAEEYKKISFAAAEYSLNQVSKYLDLLEKSNGEISYHKVLIHKLTGMDTIHNGFAILDDKDSILILYMFK